MLLENRKEAGQLFAEKLQSYTSKPNTLVLALPRGGVPVGYEIAKKLHLPLDIFLVRKLGMPGYEEVAFGAIADGGTCIMDPAMIRMASLSQTTVDQIIELQTDELNRRRQAYRGDTRLPPLKHQCIILVDDGMATGSTLKAAITAIKEHIPEKIIVALPVAPASVYEDLAGVDEIICLMTPTPFNSVGQWYKDFSQTTDDEVRHLLQTSKIHAQEAA